MFDFIRRWLRGAPDRRPADKWTIAGRSGTTVTMHRADFDCPVCGQPGAYCTGGQCPYDPEEPAQGGAAMSASPPPRGSNVIPFRRPPKR